MDILKARVESEPVQGRRSVKSFVLRSSRLAPYQHEAVALYSDRYVLPFTSNYIDFHEIFGNHNPTIVEIGFGMGASTQRIAIQNPLTNYIGIEVYVNGFCKLLSAAGQLDIQNLRLIRFDAIEVLEYMIPKESVSGFHVFFPDPWPKKKHHKRRLIQPSTARLFAEKLQQGGYVYCVTDWEEYAMEMLEVFACTDGLTNPYDGFAPSRPWRPMTRFEEKGLEKNHRICEIWVEKT